MSNVTINLIILGILATSIAVTYVWGRIRSGHICTCGHRRDQHADDWGSYCDVCSCDVFVRRSLTRKDTGDRIDG